MSWSDPDPTARCAECNLTNWDCWCPTDDDKCEECGRDMLSCECNEFTLEEMGL